MNILSMIFGPIFGIVDDVIKDKAQAEQLKAQLQTTAIQAVVQSAVAQATINANEANSRSMFVAGWRPFVGWICAVAFAYQAIGIPLITFGCAFYQIDIPMLPSIPFNELLGILGGLLGLGTLHTVDKINGVE